MKTETIQTVRKQAGSAGGAAGTGAAKSRKRHTAKGANSGGIRQKAIDRVTSRQAGSVPGFESIGDIGIVSFNAHCNAFLRSRGLRVNENGMAGTIHAEAQAGLRRKLRVES